MVQETLDKNINQDQKTGRKRINKEIRDLIFRMAGENRWGAPRTLIREV